MAMSVPQLSTDARSRRPSSRSAAQVHVGVVAAAMVVATAFLFVNLGHYALWDDEANTALIGEGVWQNGDTSAMLGQNIVAYNGGVELSGSKERYLPPLQYYVVAPFVGLWPGSALAARFPFTVFGWLSIVLIFWWICQAGIRPLTLLLTAMALIGNVSLWLYLRQCRYYSLSIFFSLAIVYLYLAPMRKVWTVPLIALLSVGLLAANYINYAALYAILAVDWVVWSRKRFPLSRLDALWLLLPQLIIGAPIVYTWNPLNKKIFGGAGPDLFDRMRLFWWAWRDLNRCEFSVLVLLVAAPFVSIWRRNQLLLRAFLALLCYVLVVISITPQNPSLPMNPVLQPIRLFDVRYLAPAIPLMIAVSVLTITQLFQGNNWWPALLVGALAFGTNVLNGGSMVGHDALDRRVPIAHAAVLLYTRELLHPPADPYTLTAGWINTHITPGQSVWVLPQYMTYPLMFHAPGPLYAWQLPQNPPADLRGLNPMFYKGGPIPDYLICFGPDPLRIVRGIRFPSSMHAQKLATIDFYWHDLYRPELGWRVFTSVMNYRPDTEAIQIFRLLISR